MIEFLNYHYRIKLELSFLKHKNHDIHSDKELITAFCEKGDLEILGVLYNRYMHLVYGLCIKYLKDREESKDAVMQIFEVLITDIPKFDINNFKSWLYVVSKNYCLMKLRKESSVQKKMQDYQSTEFMESTEILHPLDENENEYLQEKLKECMELLKDAQKKCVELFYYQQKCYKEISMELEIEEMKVKSYIQNGKRNLKICIEQKAITNEA
jgi:RNA polymerase sigma-70 factor, ECF subfamily